MDEQQQKAMLKGTFDTVSGGYDGKALRFFQASAQHMAFLLGLQGNENVHPLKDMLYERLEAYGVQMPP